MKWTNIKKNGEIFILKSRFRLGFGKSSTLRVKYLICGIFHSNNACRQNLDELNISYASSHFGDIVA